MGKFEIKTRKDGEFQFSLKAANGEIILNSEGYTTKKACENGIESVKRNSQDDSKFESKTTASGEKYFFNLKATNGQVIGTSGMYKSVSGRDNGIESVKKNAPGAEVEDNS